ncbi:HD domain-containing protein [Entophlyctis helioformis]|nr:HD domain-containing protein [Entophlyctis helioformis]KAI8926499.1 HD domain-containing protein [Entophlyctis helioformis]
MTALEFLHICQRLKTTKRTGWVDRGVPGAESIADHMHRMGVMAMLIQDAAIDRHRLIKMAIVHDLAEAVVGDLTPHSGVSKAEKERRERDAMLSFVDLNGSSPQILEILALWEEYEAAQSPEALLCKDLDKAFEYEQATGKHLDEFYESTKGRFTHPEVKAMVDELYAERKSKLGRDV